MRLDLEEEEVSLTYPLLPARKELRENLIRQKVYMALFCPNVLRNVSLYVGKLNISKNLTHMPTDLRDSLKISKPS